MKGEGNGWYKRKPRIAVETINKKNHQIQLVVGSEEKLKKEGVISDEKK
jgi:hypothetical protein